MNNAQNLNDLEFNYKFVDLFTSLQDSNTQYHIPGHHSCLVASTGFVLDEALINGALAIVVSDIKVTRLSPSLAWLNIGDKLLTIDGTSINALVRNSQAFSVFRSMRPSLRSFYRVDGKLNKFPQKNQSIYTFKNAAGQTYTVNLPWLVEVNDECVEQATAVTDAIRSGYRIKPPRINEVEAPQNRSLNPKIFFNVASNPIVEWSIYEPERRKLGVIKLKTFGDEHNNATEITLAIRDLLQRELADTNAIVFDVRTNSGGPLGYAAELIPQLFAPNEILPDGGRLVVHPINAEILANSRSGELRKWHRAYRLAGTSDRYSPMVRFTEISEANYLGRVYNKPVGVFTSINCYGACEVFGRTMGFDSLEGMHAGAQIFGEDSFTGGILTNSADYNTFLSVKSPKNFPALPFIEQMPLAAPNFKVGWQQYGRNWEYFGVRIRRLIKPTVDDIRNPNEWSSQFDRIAAELLPEFKRNPHRESNTRPNQVFEIDQDECLACQERLKDTIISPCGHFCVCRACCEQLEMCPMCRQDIDCVVPAEISDPMDLTE